VAYILDHSGSKLILVDHEFASLVEGVAVPVIVSKDTGRAGDPYEDFLSKLVYTSRVISVLNIGRR
jgi:hypothetical protein